MSPHERRSRSNPSQIARGQCSAPRRARGQCSAPRRCETFVRSCYAYMIEPLHIDPLHIHPLFSRGSCMCETCACQGHAKAPNARSTWRRSMQYHTCLPSLMLRNNFRSLLWARERSEVMINNGCDITIVSLLRTTTPEKVRENLVRVRSASPPHTRPVPHDSLLPCLVLNES